MTIDFQSLDHLVSFLANLIAVVGAAVILLRWLRRRQE
jgi:hypothetical protein